MSTMRVSRRGGADRVGLENLLGTNDHPMSGMSYSRSLLGGSLMGVIPLTEGRYACFFREYSYVEGGDFSEGTNRILLVSTVSGGSRVINLGIEDKNWIDFDSSGDMGYLLSESNGVSEVSILRGDIDEVRLLDSIPTPIATKEGGRAIPFSSGLSVAKGKISLFSIDEGELYVAQRSQTGLSGAWEFLSGNTFRSSSRDLIPQQGVNGAFSVRGRVHFVDIKNSRYLFDQEGGEVLIYKKNRHGSWESHERVVFSGDQEEVIGFCLVKSVPAYSEDEYRYTIPAVFSLAGSPISQSWAKITFN